MAERGNRWIFDWAPPAGWRRLRSSEEEVRGDPDAVGVSEVFPLRTSVKISVNLLVDLHKHSPTGEPRFALDVSHEATVGSVLTDLGLPQKELKVVLVNGRQASPGQRLNEHDLLVVFPSMEGG